MTIGDLDEDGLVRLFLQALLLRNGGYMELGQEELLHFKDIGPFKTLIEHYENAFVVRLVSPQAVSAENLAKDKELLS